MVDAGAMTIAEQAERLAALRRRASRAYGYERIPEPLLAWMEEVEQLVARDSLDHRSRIEGGSLIQLDPSLTDDALLAWGVRREDLPLCHRLQRYGFRVASRRRFGDRLLSLLARVGGHVRAW